MSKKIISVVLACTCNMGQVTFEQVSVETLLTDAPQTEALQAEVLQADTLQAEAPIPEAPQTQTSSSEPAPRAEPVVKVEQGYWAAKGLNARVRKACTITLCLMGPVMASLETVDEAQLKDAGCEYSTEDAALIANFTESVESVSVRSNSFALQLEPREAAYLALGGDNKMKLLFEKPYQNQSEVPGQINGQPVTVNKSLVEGLCRWAAKVDRVRRCESFVGKYRQATHALSKRVHQRPQVGIQRRLLTGTRRQQAAKEIPLKPVTAQGQ